LFLTKFQIRLWPITLTALVGINHFTDISTC
jgi:hypothetical protein